MPAHPAGRRGSPVRSKNPLGLPAVRERSIKLSMRYKVRLPARVGCSFSQGKVITQMMADAVPQQMIGKPQSFRSRSDIRHDVSGKSKKSRTACQRDSMV